VGALVWRMHRCARIVFSLSFHLKRMTAVECVQFLMDRVGFDKANAEGEVRRSFNGSYPPLPVRLHAGALQFYALHKELVDSGKMTNRAFHDACTAQGERPHRDAAAGAQRAEGRARLPDWLEVLRPLG